MAVWSSRPNLINRSMRLRLCDLYKFRRFVQAVFSSFAVKKKLYKLFPHLLDHLPQKCVGMLRRIFPQRQMKLNSVDSIQWFVFCISYRLGGFIDFTLWNIAINCVAVIPARKVLDSPPTNRIQVARQARDQRRLFVEIVELWFDSRLKQQPSIVATGHSNIPTTHQT